MFDRAPSSRRAKAWRPDPGLLSHSRGFATSRWGDNDDGFMVDDIKRTKDGFALDEYAQVPLSPQAVAALKRLQGMAPDEPQVIAVDDIEMPEKFQPETWNANAHLPFVADDYDYEYDDDLAQRMADEALHTEVTQAETTQAEPTAPETTHTEAPEADAVPADASHASESIASDDASTATADAAASDADDHADVLAQTEEPIAESDAHASDNAHDDSDAAQALSDEAAPVSEPVEPTDSQEDSQAHSQAQADADTSENTNENAAAEAAAEHTTPTVSDQDADSTPAAELAPDPEPVLTQSELTSADTLAPEQMAPPLDEMVDEMVDEVVDDVTLPAPVLTGIDPEIAAQREAEKFAEGLAQGIAQGERQAHDAMQQEVQAQCTVLANVTQELHALLQDSKAFYEPMKRLALHLAEQITLAELRTSTHAIEQLIQRCLDELDHPAQGLVVLELNPEDKSRLQAQNPELIRGMRLEAVHDMAPGSVRVFANDAVVEDLVTHRLHALAQSMLVDVPTWQAQSELAKPEAATHDTESEDVHS